MPPELLQQVQGLDAVGVLLLAVNVLLLIAAPFLVRNFSVEEANDSSGFIRKVRILRAINLLLIIIVLFRVFGVSSSSDGQQSGWLLKAIGVLAILYFAYLLATIASFFIVRYYGQEKEIQGVKRRVPNYQSRIVSIFSSVFIAIMALISIVQLIEQDHLLKAGGIIGFMGVFLALTQSTWAPDIFSGLIILNSSMAEEGDIIEVDDGSGTVYGMVYKTRIFHTVILNLINNHRVMIRNSRLRDLTVHNLSKFASAKGLRETLSFKIGYECSVGVVSALFDEVFKRVAATAVIKIEHQHGYHLGVHETGDHAVEWRVFYFTKAVDQLPKIRQQLIEEVLQVATEQGVSLATPITHLIEGGGRVEVT